MSGKVVQLPVAKRTQARRGDFLIFRPAADLQSWVIFEIAAVDDRGFAMGVVDEEGLCRTLDCLKADPVGYVVAAEKVCLDARELPTLFFPDLNDLRAYLRAHVRPA